MISRVKIKVIGKNPNYFLEELLKRKINIYYLDKKSKELILVINYDSYLELLSFKTTYEINLIERYGVNKIKYLLHKYSLLIFLIGLGIIFNIVLSKIVFKIDIVHSNQELKNVVLRDLEDLGIKKYHFKTNYYNLQKIKEKLKEKEKDKIEWIEIREQGTKYIVELEEKKLSKEKKKCSPRNIIASKNALIISTEASVGEIVVGKDDYVSKGDVLISGIIHNKEEAISKECARGNVYGEVWYKVVVSIPKVKEEKIPLNKNRLALEISFLNKKYKSKEKEQVLIKNEYNIIDSNFIPINYRVIKNTKVKIIKKNYSNKEISELALDTASKRIRKKLKKGERLLDKKVLKKSEKNSKIEVDVFIRVKMKINAYQDISKINLEDLNKKEE